MLSVLLSSNSQIENSLAAYMTDEEVLKGVIYPSISRYKMAFIISYCVLSPVFIFI